MSASSTTKRRVAVLGASGIGRHHANWWTVEGAEVCAFLGSSRESVAATAEKLAGMFGFTGNGYTDLAELLATEKPDIVDVCTPPEHHFEHTRAALAAGCQVLCEKPFVYDATLPHEQLLTQASELVAQAEAAGVLFGICTQYVLASEICLELLRDLRDGDLAPTFRGELVSPTRGRAPNAIRTWVDLSPHMLGALHVFAPEGTIRWESLATEFSGHRARARFLMDLPDGRVLEADIDTNHTDGEPSNVRRLEFGKVACDIEGTRDGDGHFCADIRIDSRSYLFPDSLRLLIRRFLAGEAAVPGAVALVGLERMLRVIGHAQGSR
jgi:predicted dehydrogenase